MKDIEKKDWDKLFDKKNLNFEEDFNELVARYYKREEERIKNEKFLERLRDSANLGTIKDMLTRDNWILDLHIYGDTYMDFKTLFLKKYELVLNIIDELRNVK